VRAVPAPPAARSSRRSAVDSRDATAVRDGLAWLARDLDSGRAAGGRPDLPQLPNGLDLPISSEEHDDFYYLYGLERACMLAAVASLGEVAWWEDGAERMLARRKESGAFVSLSRNNGRGRAEIDTCFALLFLRRAVFRTVDRRAVTPSGGGSGK